MEFNVTKCHVMHVGRHNRRHIYSMDGTALAETEEERDIGVVVSNSLKPTAQCRKAAQTANAVLGQLLRAFHFRDRHTFLDLYKQQVRPHLEFAVAAWSPWARADIDCLERVQQKAVSGLKGRTYEERLTEVGLPSLQDRRKETDMVQTFKIVRGIDVVDDFLKERASARPQTRQNDGYENLIGQRSHHEFRKNFFSVRVTSEWNGLPDSVKEARNVTDFKRLYRRHRADTVAPASDNP